MDGNANLPVKAWNRIYTKAYEVFGSWANVLVLYRPLIALTVMVTMLTTIYMHGRYPSSHVYQNTMRWKHYGLWVHAWMGVFYIIVALLKLRDINGFVDAFVKYDVISSRYRYYGYVYPFLELVLGVMMIITNIIQQSSSLPLSLLILDSRIPLVSSIILMMSTSIGACRILINKPKQKIRCACMGVHYADLPMSTITLFENAVMMVMSIYCLIAR